MSLALHYWMGGAHHCSGPPVSEMTYTVSSGTLNPSIPYQTILLRLAPLRVRSVIGCLQSGQFWARSTASVHDSPLESRSFCTVFIQIIRGRPGGLFQYTEGEKVKTCFASTLSFIRAICRNRVRRRAWIISVSRGWLVWRRTSSLEMKWYHLMPRSIRRHHWWRPLILRASFLVIAQHSDP